MNAFVNSFWPRRLLTLSYFLHVDVLIKVLIVINKIESNLDSVNKSGHS